jgi:long-subunit acyl-CoA synthetase (AMP-forming)
VGEIMIRGDFLFQGYLSGGSAAAQIVRL